MNAETLRSVLDYDAETGVFRWRSGTIAGRVAGCSSGMQYHKIWVHAKRYRAHRLAWLYVYGEWPNGGLDHINGDRYDNRIANLRLATQSQNGANAKRQKRNKSGYKGVYWVAGERKWRARITIQRKVIRLGRFETPELAHAAYMAAAREAFGEFARAE